jgi:hypothetical protein
MVKIAPSLALFSLSDRLETRFLQCHEISKHEFCSQLLTAEFNHTCTNCSQVRNRTFTHCVWEPKSKPPSVIRFRLFRNEERLLTKKEGHSFHFQHYLSVQLLSKWYMSPSIHYWTYACVVCSMANVHKPRQMPNVQCERKLFEAVAIRHRRQTLGLTPVSHRRSICGASTISPVGCCLLSNTDAAVTPGYFSLSLGPKLYWKTIGSAVRMHSSWLPRSPKVASSELDPRSDSRDALLN